MGNSPDTSKNGDSRNSSIHEKDAAATNQETTVKSESIPATKLEPLAPPPRPEPVANTPDYFSSAHTNPAPHLATESNPFDFSFGNGNGDVQTPGGTKLPSVAALASPAGLLGQFTPGLNWGSLRSGPLSPAMLSGPAKGGDDYFSDNHHLRGGFPTPNESGMRSGLTPGGGGSMFPDPTPTSGLLGSFGSGGATPSTLEFQRSVLNAIKQREALTQQHNNVTSQPQEPHDLDVKPPTSQFDQHDPQEAANSLFMLANNRTNPQPPAHYAQAPQTAVHGHPQPLMHMNGQSQHSSPTMAAQTNGSISTSGRAASEMSTSDNEQQPRSNNTRGKGKRNSTQITNGRGKANNASKGPASKKAKANNGHSMPELEDEEQEELDMSKDEYNANGKKMTDEEKRKNFLERNRVAALKCRQRKKQWLANLQAKVEMYSSENDNLGAQIAQLREEVVALKNLLLAHKECPIAQQQGIQGLIHQHAMDGYNGQMNPYGMAPS
ncbi:putative transcription factor atf1 [Calycina marina]|uniref:Transcription factor atf1 n=1 Tax=Calycina marina TaxID=1763456 RepID=A0A9P7Z1P0_9HELO|nr:putative transcription factor atf1 [Calycina marina]